MKTIKEILSESVDLEKFDVKLNDGHSLQDVDGLEEAIMPVLQAVGGALTSMAIGTAVRARAGIAGAIGHGLQYNQNGKLNIAAAFDRNRQLKMERMQNQQNLLQIQQMQMQMQTPQ